MSFTDRFTRHATFIPGPMDVLHAVKKWIVRRNKRNRLAVLLDQEDWVLKDMGVTRGDVYEALAHRGDPALHLRALVARRRFWTRKRDMI